MSLLRKASIVTTPTSYENGKILSVKPSVVFGEELVVNGTFQTDSDWIKASEVTIQNNSATFTLAPSGQQVSQAISSVIGKKYKIIYEIKSITQGAFDVSIGGSLSSNYNNSVGIYTEYLTATTTSGFYVRSRGTTNGSITNVSVKEVLDADFDFTRNSSATRTNSQGLIEDMQILSGDLVTNGDFSQEGSELVANGDFNNGSTNWNLIGTATITENQANIVTASAVTGISQSNILTVGKSYKLSYNIVSNNNGGLKISGNEIPSVVGNNTYYFEASAESLEILRNSGVTDISIDNVSVKEVGQDWTVTNSDANNYVVFNGSTARLKFLNTSPLTTLTSDTQYLRNKKYKLTVDVQDVVSGAIKIDADVGSELFDSVGIHERILEPTGSSNIIFYRATSNVDITLNSVSLIEITEDTNLPRIDYTGGEGHWLFEPQSTNLITYSEDATNWSTQANSVLATSNQAVSPDGTLNADKLIPASGSVTSNGGRYLSFASTASTDYSVSIFVKQAEYRYVTFSYGSTAACGFHFDLQDGVIIQELSNAQYTSISREVESFTNGWYRLKISLTDSITQSTRFISVRPANELPTATNNNYATTGDGTSGIYVWGLQIEQNSYATSYIPTSGSTVTRLADAAFGAGSSDLINSTEGVLYAEIAALADDDIARNISLGSGDRTNTVEIFYGTSTNQISFKIRANNSNVTVQNRTVSDRTQFAKVAIKYKSGDIEFFINGVKEVDRTDSFTFSSSLSELAFDRGDGSDEFEGKTKCVAVFKEALTDAELTCLTTI